jgi:hypothetical protein
MLKTLCVAIGLGSATAFAPSGGQVVSARGARSAAVTMSAEDGSATTRRAVLASLLVGVPAAANAMLVSCTASPWVCHLAAARLRLNSTLHFLTSTPGNDPTREGVAPLWLRA